MNGLFPPLRGVVIAGLLLSLGACVGGGAPPDNFYRVTLPASTVLPAPLLPGVVEVGRFTAEGMTGERAMLYSYRDTPDQVQRYGYQLWTDPPPVLLQNQLVLLLRAGGVAPTVVTADLHVPPDFLIEGRLRRFEQIVGPPSAVRVDMDIGVVRLHGGELLHLASYRVEKPVTSDKPADAVEAYQAALSEIFRRFIADLAEIPPVTRSSVR
ncbi:ABC-type transport auxiliary lipoprotein family protein [Telmatospirillum sp.]|uniref:ABC-type transport auxiliary lipoprotein family protein n=1 Tax=Telmatospirillum sp. TaxID=2079197 RepID=UPI00283AF9A5|nr:ABC-type transport auxiliary lipoprotein family protein [Telmatospirillum sp.]MDR3438427.1 ABC-type transport auxiliary lipoprotein family protein [Telmatospirillum sp.]